MNSSFKVISTLLDNLIYQCCLHKPCSLWIKNSNVFFFSVYITYFTFSRNILINDRFFIVFKLGKQLLFTLDNFINSITLIIKLFRNFIMFLFSRDRNNYISNISSRRMKYSQFSFFANLLCL